MPEQSIADSGILIDIEKLASAHSEQNKQVNRRWVVCAGLSLLAFNIDPTKDTMVFSTVVSAGNIYPILIAVLSLTNFVYVVAHISAYKTAIMFQEICSEANVDNKKISKNFNSGDYLHSMIASNYNRVRPLFEPISNHTIRTILNKSTKFIVDTVQFSIVPAAIITVLQRMTIETKIEYLVWIPGVLSISASLALWLKSIFYIIGFKA